jgi:lipopolysaccharide/colanic/teichoic acid biosynthesis glycosyltransferase
MSSFEPKLERRIGVIVLASQIPQYQEYHMVGTGLTGLAQINDPCGTMIDDTCPRMSYEANDARSFPILFDPVIVLQTLRVMLWLSGVR